MHNPQRIDAPELESLRLDLDRTKVNIKNSGKNTKEEKILQEDGCTDPIEKDDSAPLFYAAIDSARGTGPAHVTNEPLRDDAPNATSALNTVLTPSGGVPAARPVREISELPPYIQPTKESIPHSPVINGTSDVSSQQPLYYPPSHSNNPIARPSVIGVQQQQQRSSNGSYNRQGHALRPNNNPNHPSTHPAAPNNNVPPQQHVGLFSSLPTIPNSGRSETHSRIMGSIAMNPSVLPTFIPSGMNNNHAGDTPTIPGLPSHHRWDVVEDQNRGLDKKIFVGGLHYSTTDHDLKEFFESQFGPVLEAHTVKNREGQSRGFGFVIFERVESRYRAVASDSVDCYGARVDIRAATPPTSHAPPHRAAASWHRMSYDEAIHERNQHNEMWRSIGSNYRRAPMEYARERSPPLFYPSYYPPKPTLPQNPNMIRDDTHVVTGNGRPGSNWRRSVPQRCSEDYHQVREEGAPVLASAVQPVVKSIIPSDASTVNCVEFHFVDE